MEVSGEETTKKAPIKQPRWQSKGAIAGIIAIIVIIFNTVGIPFESLNTWAALWDNILMILSNPFLLGSIGVAVFAFYNDAATRNKV